MTILRIAALSKRFGPTTALDEVNFELRRGEVHALIGENGAGKSTLMNVLAGAIKPDRGAIEVDGRPYAPASPLDARRAGIALIHQELSLCPHLTVAENVLMGIEPSRLGIVDAEAARARALEVLEAFHHPEIRPERRVADLPLAARQVVEICRAIAARARIILMDEPTSSLPRADVDRLFGLVRRLREAGVSIVYISHFLEEVREIADRYTVLRDGRDVSAGELTGVTNDQLVAHMVGRPVDYLFPPRPPLSASEPGELLLDVRGLSAPPAVRDASFAIRGGEVLGVAGLMGSGRTELVRALMGLDPFAAGAITLRGCAVASTTGVHGRIRAGFGYLSEDRTGEGLALAQSVADNVTLTRLAACATRGWLSLARQGELAAGWAKRLAIRIRDPFQPVRTLSGGNQQKVALARLLHQNADVLLLDEPTRGIDIGSKAQIYEIIAAAAAEGKAILMVSSYLPELFGVCDRLAVMSRGRLSEARPIAAWTPESVMRAAIGG